MSQTTSEPTTWSYRMHLRSNKETAMFLIVLANILGLLTRILPAELGQSLVSLALQFKNASILVVQPQNVRLSMKPTLYYKVIGDCLLLLVPVALALVFRALERSHAIVLTLPSLLLCGLLFFLVVFVYIFSVVVNLLLLSGDIYSKQKDELQRVVSQQAGGFVLPLTVVCLVGLFLCYLFFPGSRDLAALHLALLLVVVRIAYLFKLLSLRWQALGMVELTANDEADTFEF